MEATFERQAKLKAQLQQAHADLKSAGFKKAVADAEFRQAKQKRKRKSFLRRLRAYFSDLIHLPRINRRIDRSLLEWDDFTVRWSQLMDARDKSLQGDMDVKYYEAMAYTDTRLQNMQDVVQRLEKAEQTYVDFERRLDDKINRLQERIQLETVRRHRAITDIKAPVSNAQESMSVTQKHGDAHTAALMETFYFLLEERYRGTTTDIQKRLEYYLPDLLETRTRIGDNKPVVDIGCGRGEFVNLLRQHDFEAVGIDFNNTQLDLARQQGLPVLHGDARVHLEQQDENTLLAITGIHIVEHINFRDLLRLCAAAFHALSPGGIVIFETPNPANLIVGAHTFNLDPTHIKPLPMEVMELVLETVGFTNISKRPLHPSPTRVEMIENERIDPHIADLLFGAQDYAVIGHKVQ